MTEHGFHHKFRDSKPERNENPVHFATRLGHYLDRWMNGVLGHFYALSRLNWAGTTWANEMNLG